MLFFIKIFISIAVLWFLIRSAQIKFELFASLFQRPFLFASVILIFLMMVAIGAWRWYLLNVSQGIYLSLLKTFLPTYLGVAFNNLLPGSIGGDFVRMHYLFKKIPDKKSIAALTIFFDRVLGFMGIFITLCFVAIFQIRFFSQQPKLSYMLIVCIGFCMIVTLLFITSVGLSQKIGLDRWLNQHFSHKKWTKPFVSFLNTTYIYRVSKMVIFQCLIISAVMQILISYAAFIISDIMELPHIAFSHYLIALSVSQIVNLIPITPGGIGVGELAFANILVLLNPGINAPFATIFLAYRLISMLTYLPVAIFYIPKFITLEQTTIE